MSGFSGLGVNLGNLSRISAAETRSISPENFTGARGAGGKALDGTGAVPGRALGQGWKLSPSVEIAPGALFTLAEIEGPGAVQQIWCVTSGVPWRDLILRIHWDGQAAPSVECPLGDFFANGWEEFAQVTSLAVCVNPGRAFNCYWEMPFRTSARITLENRNPKPVIVYYQITYALTEVPDDAAYFHAQFRRVNPVPKGDVYTILDGVRGRGQYVGTYLAWGSNSGGWWGEGEVKFYLDGDDWPTICGTGTEDYFCGGYNFDPGVWEGQGRSGYTTYNTPYAGLPQVIRPDGLYRSQMRFGMYRWHIPDPIRFREDLAVTVQALGWRHDDPPRYVQLQDDLASVAFWYQTLPTATFPVLPDREALEVI